MRVIVQRVMKASVTVGEELVSSIGKGICVLVGISRDDTPKDIEHIVRKVLNLRVFEDNDGKRWARNVMEKQYEVLCVSQFTLYATMKGNKPDYHLSMGGEQSESFYKEFLQAMSKSYEPEKIKDGLFGAYMQVHIQNDGPVTITLESPLNTGQEQKGKQKGGMKKVPSSSDAAQLDKVKDMKSNESQKDLTQEFRDKVTTEEGAST